MSTSIGFLLLLITVGFALLCLGRPIWALSLLVMMWATEQLLQTFLPFLLDRGILFNAFVAIVVTIAATRSVVSNRANIWAYANPVLFCITLLYLLGMASLGWTSGFEFGSGQVVWLGPYILIGVFIAPLLPRDIGDFTEFRTVLTVGGTVIALALLANPNFQFYGDRAMIQLSGSSERGNPLAIAELGSLVAMIAALSRDRGTAGFKLALRIGVVLIGLGLALQTGSRGQVIASVLALAILFPVAKRADRLPQQIATLLGTVVLLGAVYFTVGLFVGDENERRWSFESLSEGSSGRLQLVTAYASAWIQDPVAWVLGFGTGSFRTVCSEFSIDFVENLFAEIVFELGIVGLVLLIPVLVIPFRSSVWMIRNAPDPTTRINATVLLGMWIVYMIIAAKSYNLWTGFPFFYISVIIAKCGKVARAEWEEWVPDHADEDDEEEAFLEDAEDDFGEIGGIDRRPNLS